MDNEYIKFDNSTEFRKDILKLALDATKLIKYNEENKNIRKQKQDKLIEINAKIKELNSSINSFLKILPKTEELQLEKKSMAKMHQQPKNLIKQEKKELSDIEKLGIELKSIEEKISRL